MRLREQLQALGPTEFENVVYDLLVAAGLRNPVWRTPGADGGRDIEGEILRVDFAGTITRERWYVECKRYESALGWPTVREKLAYAENQTADFLLICTTSSLSPACLDELHTWERRGARPVVRCWNGADLENRIPLFPTVMVKYAFSLTPEVVRAATSSLVLLASKAMQSAYGKAAGAGAIDPALEYSAALLELVRASMEHPENIGRWRVHGAHADLYDWCEVDQGVDLSRCDALAIRALLCAARFASQGAPIKILQDASAGALRIEPRSGSFRKEHQFFQTIPLWSNLEVTADDTGLQVRARAEND